MRRRLPFSLLVPALLAFVALPDAVKAQKTSASEELLRLVPDDVTFCLVLNDLHGHRERLQASPFMKQWKGSSLAALIKQSGELRQLAQIEQFLKTQLGVTATQVIDDILGEAVVFAFRVDPTKDKKDEGIVLLRARNADTVAKVLKLINQFAGKVEKRRHLDTTYFRRVEGDDEGYFLQDGSLFIYTGQESLMRQAIAGRKKASELPLTVAKQIREAGADKALLALWVNPRSFDADLLDKQKAAKGAEQSFLQTFAKCWSQIRFVVASLELKDDLRINLHVRLDADGLPDGTRKFFEELGARSELWSRFPKDAIVASALRLDAPALLSMIADFQTKTNVARLHKDVNLALVQLLGTENGMESIVPYVGPDWGWYVAAPAATAKTWFPAVLFAVRIQSGEGKPSVRQALWSSMQGAVAIGVFWYNRKNPDAPVVRKTFRHDDGDVHYLTGAAGRRIGLQPTLGLQGSYLVVASSPETWRDFAARKPAPSTSGHTPFLRISFKELRSYLAARGDALVDAWAAQQPELTKEQYARQLRSLSELTELLDELEISQSGGKGKVTLTLRARLVASLAATKRGEK